uniref:Uncharacterized protein n=1 Tax=Timema tahoe TaxID=61484 RepID=A0A7R9P0P8_9NEOP|nr:unnamed protein product [Timema tahoe]
MAAGSMQKAVLYACRGIVTMSIKTCFHNSGHEVRGVRLTIDWIAGDGEFRGPEKEMGTEPRPCLYKNTSIVLWDLAVSYEFYGHWGTIKEEESIKMLFVYTYSAWRYKLVRPKPLQETKESHNTSSLARKCLVRNKRSPTVWFNQLPS